METTDLPYILFAVGKNVYGINGEFVQAIETLGEFTSVMASNPNIRGGVVYQNKFIHLVDMRKLFGFGSQIEELEKSINPEQRIKDHEKWVEALEMSIRDRTEFTLSDDCHECALGKWYYSFKTNDDVLSRQVRKIEAPHQAVHDAAKQIKQLMRNNDYESAMAVLQELRATHYKTLVHIMSSLIKNMAYTIKELFIVIKSGEHLHGIIVDSIVGIEPLDNMIYPNQAFHYPDYIKSICQRKDDNSIVIVLDTALIAGDQACTSNS